MTDKEDIFHCVECHEPCEADELNEETNICFICEPEMEKNDGE